MAAKVKRMEKIAPWFYWAFASGVLKCPADKSAGFVYDITADSDCVLLENIMKLAKGGDIATAQGLLLKCF